MATKKAGRLELGDVVITRRAIQEFTRKAQSVDVRYTDGTTESFKSDQDVEVA